VVEIVAEKDESTYRRHCQVRSSGGYDLDVGNSPKSDINPALAAGLHAVFIPTTTRGFWNTRKLPRSGIQRLLVVDRFGDLREHF